jgi:transposase
MEVLVERGAGLDVHKKSVTVCVMTTEGRSVVKTLHRFSTFHSDLLAMRQWLVEQRVTHVAMEATGEFWKPVYKILEEHFEVLVANAQHVKNVPGRKTDPEDASWLARLLRHGLLEPSFVPDRPIRDLRDQTRMRRKTVQMISRVENRSQKVLEASGIKIGSVVSDVFGGTGRAILGQLAQHKTDPVKLAQLAKGSLKGKRDQIKLSLEGTFSAHDARLLEHQLDLHGHLETQREAIEKDIESMAGPYERLLNRLDQIPGINRDASLAILGEIGADMSPWKDHRFFASWAGLCPGNHESAGKRRKVSVRKGNPFLKATLVQAATAAVRTEGSYYQAKFRRLIRRRGYKRAVVAVAHSILIAIYHMIRDDVDYRELGADYFDQRTNEAKALSLAKKLQRLGYQVNYTPVQPQIQAAT